MALSPAAVLADDTLPDAASPEAGTEAGTGTEAGAGTETGTDEIIPDDAGSDGALQPDAGGDDATGNPSDSTESGVEPDNPGTGASEPEPEPEPEPAKPVVKWHKRSFPSSAKRTRVNVSDGTRFDPRIIAGEKTPGYDTIQGVAYNGNYGYFVLYNRNNTKVKIAKIDMRTNELVLKSPAYSYRTHGNTLTYNTKTNQLVMPIGKSKAKKVAVISAKTLKIVKTKKLPISRRTIGKRYDGIAGIAYNSAKNVYVVKLSGKVNKFVILTSSFKRKKVVKIKGNVTTMMNQGIYSEGNYTYDIKSFHGKRKYNLIIVRKLYTGKVVKKIKVSCGTGSRKYELENICVDKKTNDVYAAFYRAYVLKAGDLQRENYLYKITNM